MHDAEAPTCLTRHRLSPQGRAYLAVAFCLIAARCSLAPDYHRPDSGVPATWDSALGEQAHQVPAQGAWWHSFDSPELDGLMQQSLSRNFNLQAAVARIAEAQGSAEVSAAPLFPSVSVAGTQYQQNGAKNTQTHQLVAQASYELDFWGKNRAAAGSAQALAIASAFDADTVAMT
jgi:outer membrane protein TolC